jgi:hypothetical protein
MADIYWSGYEAGYRGDNLFEGLSKICQSFEERREWTNGYSYGEFDRDNNNVVIGGW